VTTVADVIGQLASVIPPGIAATWDPVGLQLGDPGAGVGTIGVCHEITEEVVSSIEDSHLDLLITYHPLLFDPVNRLVEGRSPTARAIRLLRAGVNVMVVHTNFDAAPGGTADALATALGLSAVEPFGARPEEGLHDIGRVGGFPGSLGDLAVVVAEQLGSWPPRVSGDSDRTLSRVAVVPGSGADFLSSAAPIADAMVTGDVSHHRAVAALDAGLAVIDPGHIATERPGLAALVATVREVVDYEVADLTHFDPQTWV
jgi:dinuclear metal center YbgI/SA1388 family protein